MQVYHFIATGKINDQFGKQDLLVNQRSLLLLFNG